MPDLLDPSRGSDRQSFRRSFSASALTTGFVAVLVSYAGPFLIVLQAASEANLSVAETTSWVWAISIGSGLTCLILSLLTRQPIITAWSTPGAALLLAILNEYRFSDAVGAFLIAGVVAAVLGYTGLFGKLLAIIPGPILSALLAGVLLPFVMQAAGSVGNAPLVAGGLVITYVLGRRFFPRYAVLGALVVGCVLSALNGDLVNPHASLSLDGPHWTTPTFNVGAIVGIAVPLLIVTMASQNGPGLEMLRNSGYKPNDRLLVGGTATAWIAMAPFGGHAINLAAITAGICTGRESNEDPAKRWVAGVFCGIFYLVLGSMSTSLVALFTAIPTDMVTALAGVALIGALLSSLKDSFTPSVNSPVAVTEAALVTLAVTASGMTVWSIGSAFWGVVAGCVVLVVLRIPTRTRTAMPHP